MKSGAVLRRRFTLRQGPDHGGTRKHRAQIAERWSSARGDVLWMGRGCGPGAPIAGLAADFFETLFELARRRDLNAQGLPSMLQLSLSVPPVGREIRMTSPPWPVQRLALAPLAPLARLRGLSPTYK